MFTISTVERIAHRLVTSATSGAIGGLRPREWISVGSGYSREEIKALLFKNGASFTADAVTNAEEIARKIVGSEVQLLSPLARQEVLRILLADVRINSRMPELKRLRRQGNFYRRLDFAIQSGRMAFSHLEEESVYAERLQKSLGLNPLRDEIRALAQGFEIWLEANGFTDPPLLLRRAIEILDGTWPLKTPPPDRILLLSLANAESLEQSFWEAIGRYTSVERLQAEEGRAAPFTWERWHTLDDAADALASHLAAMSPDAWNRCAVLISDSPSTRRSLKRAFADQGVLLADPRDPTRLKWEEKLKWASLPLELVSRGFERSKVQSYLHHFKTDSDPKALAQEINERGIRQGLPSFSGGKLTLLHTHLSQLQSHFGGRKRCADIGHAHLKFLKQACLSQDDLRESSVWLLPFFEKFWADFVEDMERVGFGDRAAPLLFWMERYQARMQETPSPLERIRPRQGVATYRVHQAALENYDSVFILGLPSDFSSGAEVGDYWWSAREREVLASEFAVRSSAQIREERKVALKGWLSSTSQAVFYDSNYDVDGRERESIESVLNEIYPEVDLQAIERGAHPRWNKSFGAVRPIPPQKIQLSSQDVTGGNVEVRASTLDNMSRCPFQALANDRWRVRDLDEPDTELWANEKGTLLHRAVKILVESRDDQGGFSISSEAALIRAWKEHPPKGLMKGDRILAYVQSRLIKVLQVFCEKEREYVQRSQSKPILLDDEQIQLKLGPITIVGKPDRVDENSSGLFVIDYKTSSASPNGTEMLEKGYRLQLPAYALALRAKFGKPVVGAGFVEINREGSRSSGVYFKEFNGKGEGCFTDIGPRSKSVLALSPDDAWSRFQDELLKHGVAWSEGRFEATPKKSQECDRCRVADLCGLSRVKSSGTAEASE